MSDDKKILYVEPEIFDLLEEILRERLWDYEDERLKERNMYFWTKPKLQIIEKELEENE